MNYQFNSSILIILVIYVLSFYQINCDNKTTSSSSSDSNNSSSTTLKPTIIGNEEMETQIKSGTTVKKTVTKLDDALKSFTSGSIEREPSALSNSKKRNGVGAPNDANITKPASSEHNMVLSTEKIIVINSTIATSGEVVELTKSKVSEVADKMSTTTKTSSTTETTTTTTTTTTTAKPKKPEKTLPSNELPGPPPAKPEVTKSEPTKSVQSSSNMTINNDVKINSINPFNATSIKMEPTLAPSLSVEESPKVQYSMEPLPVITSKRDYIIPVVALIFAIPILMAIATIMYRRVKDYWETRHYRRMDFLIDEMYND